MNFKWNAVAAMVLAASFTGTFALASDATPKKHKKKAAVAAAPCCAEDKIDQLRRDLQNQIDGLKSDLASKDAALRQAQQQAADAQAAADKANQASAGLADNAAAVSSLQTTVNDLKANQLSLATTVSDETSKIKKSIESPDTLHYKGVTITPGGFIAGETVYRSKATGGDIPTAFSALPYEKADAYNMSEFYGTARQSRVSLLVQGKTTWGTMRGYYEADWLGTGTSSNANQSNSYVMRQRIIYAEADTNSHWKFAGGQLWSLATEGRKGIPSSPSDIMTPQTIDPNYVPGFVWARQWGFRVVKSFDKAAFGISAENPQLLYTASLAGNTPYAVLGSAGNNGGAYNATISACSPSTSIVNYTNQAVTVNGTTVNTYVPVYKTVNSCANVTNISFNTAPDFVGKAVFDPGFGHYEIFGVLGIAQETLFPGETTNSNLYGGLKDIKTGKVVAPALTTAGWITDRIVLGGVGGSIRIPVVPNMVTVGVKGLWGPGMGRYGNSTLADVTANTWGGLVPIHNASGLVTLEATPSPRFTIYLNYGGDYAGRHDSTDANTTTLGAPSAAQNSSGVWGGHWGTPSKAAVGYGSRTLSNSACNSLAAPGYSGSSTGYYPGGSCGAHTRDVQEITGGYWYDLYRGEHGRLRQGLQYGYAVREGWSGAPAGTGLPGIGAKGIDNMVWTSFRYYLP